MPSDRMRKVGYKPPVFRIGFMGRGPATASFPDGSVYEIIAHPPGNGRLVTKFQYVKIKGKTR